MKLIQKVIKMLEVQSDSVDSNTGIVKLTVKNLNNSQKPIEKISSKKPKKKET